MLLSYGASAQEPGSYGRLTPYPGTGCIVEAEVHMTIELKIGQLAKQVGVNIETFRYIRAIELACSYVTTSIRLQALQ